MNARRPATGILARWFGWALFWCGVYYAGAEVQTWVFSKEAGPKPAAWSVTVAGLVVWVEDRLRPDRTHRIGTYALVGVMGVLLGLRLLALLPLGESAEFNVRSISSLLLGGLVLGTWISLIVGLATIGVRQLRRRDPG